MRKLIFLLTLLCLSECDEKHFMPAIMNQYTNNEIAFFTREECFQIMISKTYKLIKYTSSGGQASNEHCDDTIGFLPLPGNKVQIFVSASRKVESGSKLKSLQLMFKKNNNIGVQYAKVFDCAFDAATKNGKTTLISSSLVPTGLSGLKETEQTLKHDSEGAQELKDNLLRCPSINMNMGSVPGFWQLRKIFEKDSNSDINIDLTMEIKEIGTDVNDVTMKQLTENVRCDPSKLKIAAPTQPTADKEYNVGKLKKTLGKAGAVKLLDNGAEVPLEGTKVVQDFVGGVDKCDAGFEFISTKNGGDEKVTTGVECRKDTDKNGVVTWKYMVDRPKALKTDGSGTYDPPITEVLEVADIVEVACMQMKCRTCAPPPKEALCMQLSTCTSVGHNAEKIDENDITTCHSLTTERCTHGLIILNGKFEKFAPVQKTLCVDGTYTINNKLVESITCANIYSPQEKPVNTNLTGTEPKTLTEYPSAPADNCIALGNCSCVQTHLTKLAIVNKAGTEFLRVESLRFVNSTGDWIYERKVKVKQGDVEEEKQLTFKFDGGRTVRCVSPSVAKPKELENPDQKYVYIVNFVLIAILLAAVIPGVIFYVNARVKKREALKAAKMDKKKKGGDDKKEEQSGEKKDEDKKNSEEKKNEA